MNLLVNKGLVGTYDKDGNSLVGSATIISEQLNGFITFGCPLDKILFFLRENIPDNQYLRQQLLDNYHGFKQRDIRLRQSSDIHASDVRADAGLKRFLEKIIWRNYYDDKDYVSGGLDYYSGVTNINCNFKGGTFAFTHSSYWEHEKFYQDIIENFLN